MVNPQSPWSGQASVDKHLADTVEPAHMVRVPLQDGAIRVGAPDQALEEIVPGV